MNSLYTIYVPDRLGTGTLMFTDYGHQAPGTTLGVKSAQWEH